MIFVRRLDAEVPERGQTAPLAFPREDVMAIAPSALERTWPPQGPPPRADMDADDGDDDEPIGYQLVRGVALIDIRGPLMQRGGGFWFFRWEGYDTIRAAFESAMRAPDVGAVVLRINSPGGVVAGCFEAVRGMRAAKLSAGKMCFAYADESAYSAAYAVASVADKIYLPPEGGVGSVGVIGVLEDYTSANEKMGIKVAVITSGSHKSDGHPDVPMSDEVVRRTQARIDGLAASFASLVGESRGMSADDVLAKQAGCFYGQSAVAEGLADGVSSFERCFESAATEAAVVISKRGVAAPTNGSPAGTQQRTRVMGDTKKDQAASTATTVLEGGVAVLGTTASFGDVSTAGIAVALGLDSSASTAEIQAEVQRRDRELATEKAKREALEDARVAEASAAQATLKSTNDAHAGATLIESALDEGRILPAEEAKVREKFAAKGIVWLTDYLDARVPNPALARAARNVRQRETAGSVVVTSPGAGIPVSAPLGKEDRKAIATFNISEDKYRAARAQIDACGNPVAPSFDD